MGTSVRTVLLIGGMSCHSCSDAIGSALREVSGVQSVTISLESGIGDVRHTPDVLPAKLRSLVEDVGFEAEITSTPSVTRRVKLSISKMSCGSCAAKISHALSDHVGVVHAAVDKKTDSALVDYLEGETSVAELCAVISDLGFGARVEHTDDQLSEFELSDTSGRSKAATSMQESSREADLDLAAPVMEHILYIGGMTCEKCLEWISQAVRRVSGVQDVSISLSNKCAKIRGKMDIGRVKANITETGYSVYTDENDVPNYPAAPKDSLIPPHSAHSLTRRNSVSLSVSGMTCASCSSKIQRNLSLIPGVLEASVNLLGEKATILTDGSVDANTLVRSVSGMGFSAKELSQDSGRKISLFVQGMVCASCPPRIELALSQMSGIQSVSADLNLERVVVVYDAPLGPRGIIAKLVDLGYDAELWDKEEEDSTSRYSKSDEIKERFNQFMASMVFTLPIFLLMMVFMHIPGLKSKLMTEVIYSYDGPGIKLPAAWLVSFLLATPVQFWTGARFYTGAYRAMRNGSANMDVLIAMGTSAAYFYSVYVVIERIFNPSMSGHQFFETSAMLISFVMMGKWLEALTKGKTSEAIQKLMELQPDTAIILEFDANGKISREVEISMKLLQSGDLVKVLPGTRVPCDGEVVMGDTSVDEALVTGESMPKTKGPGDKVIGGTVNQTGLLHVRAEGVGEASMLSGIIRLVEDAQTSKAPIQAYADYISARFVPGVVFVSACTLVIWYALAASGSIPGDWTKKEGSDFLFAFMFAISVLVIACPCALGLAVPTAVMVGTGVGARHGVLIKGGKSLEIGHKVSCIVFDKTGTLTHGRPAVTDHMMLSNEVEEARFWELLASAESGSEHPLATALVTYAERHYSIKPTVPEEFEALVGKGLRCVIQGVEVKVGTRALMKESSLELNASHEACIQTLESNGKTVMLVSIAGQLAGYVAVADELKDDAVNCVTALNLAGIDVWMLTGDNLRTANAIAAQVGIRQVMAEVKPEDKSNKVLGLQREGKIVAMVGDGINDSPAIAQADLGVAIGAGTDIAVEAADMVLVRSQLMDVHLALDICRATFNRIRLNFLFSLGYNTLGIPIAAGALFPFARQRLPPEVAAFAMALSSVSVVLSSLHLKRYRPPPPLDAARPQAPRSFTLHLDLCLFWIHLEIGLPSSAARRYQTPLQHSVLSVPNPQQSHSIDMPSVVRNDVNRAC